MNTPDPQSSRSYTWTVRPREHTTIRTPSGELTLTLHLDTDEAQIVTLNDSHLYIRPAGGRR